MRPYFSAIALLLILLVSALSASGQELARIEIDPPHPTPADNVVAKLSGTWPNSCVPRNPTVTRTGQDILIETFVVYVVCLDVLTSWTLDAAIGRLPVGTYVVTARYPTYPGAPVLGRTIFSVAEPRFCGDTTGPGETDVPCHCGDVVTTDTRLNASDPVAKDTCVADGLIVGAAVRLHLGGVTIRGAGAGTGILIADGATVQNGTVVGFAIGIASDGSSARSLISNMRVNNSRFEGVQVSGDRNSILRVTAVASGTDGIAFQGDGNELVRNSCSRNGHSGLVVQGNANTLEHNTCDLNRGDGISVLGDANTLMRNVGSRNDGIGVTVDGSDNSLVHNQGLRNSGAGIHAVGSDLDSDGRNYGTKNGGVNCEVDGFPTFAGGYC
jgi:hypothetical protein